MPLTELRQYTAHTAQTATPGQLVVMLYDGFLRFCAQGRAAFEAGERAPHRAVADLVVVGVEGLPATALADADTPDDLP